MEQAFIHDEKGKSVAQAVKEAEGKIGAPVKITGFVRYALGEGIDKQEPISLQRSQRPAARNNGPDSETLCRVDVADADWCANLPDSIGIAPQVLFEHDVLEAGSHFSGPCSGESDRIMAEPLYRRVVIKLSGEYLAGAQSFRHRPAHHRSNCRRPDRGPPARGEIAVVVGGGNIVRGVEVSSKGVSRPTGDTMGMLATVMNCLALEAAIERRGTPARTLSAFVMPQICELFTRAAAH